MPAQIEQVASGPGARFPVRLPVCRLAGLVVGLVTVPVWWQVGLWVTPRVEKFYAVEYWTSLRDQIRIGAIARPTEQGYDALVVGPHEAPLLVGTAQYKAYANRVRTQVVMLTPQAFHRWLVTNVYGGDFFRMYYVPITGMTLTVLAAFLVGSSADRKRRINATEGAFRRGSRYLPIDEWNKAQVGPLWFLWVWLWRREIGR